MIRVGNGEGLALALRKVFEGVERREKHAKPSTSLEARPYCYSTLAMAWATYSFFWTGSSSALMLTNLVNLSKSSV